MLSDFFANVAKNQIAMLFT
jgi:hypothetical protein